MKDVMNQSMISKYMYNIPKYTSKQSLIWTQREHICGAQTTRNGETLRFLCLSVAVSKTGPSTVVGEKHSWRLSNMDHLDQLFVVDVALRVLHALDQLVHLVVAQLLS